MSFENISRRTALMGAAGLGLAACTETQPDLPPLPVRPGPFKHGVASGDPDEQSVMIWTAVTEAIVGQGVNFEFARDRDFTDIVDAGAMIAAGPVVDLSQPFKHLVSGLEAGTEYFYRFTHSGEISPVGRIKTLPEGPVAEFRIAAFACSNHPAGFFNAYRAAAERGDIDLALHLGDYIYEYGLGEYATEDCERMNRVPDPIHECVSAEDYMRRHAQYSLDPDLQAMKAAAPWITIWDDHETANDSHRTGAQNHQSDEGDWITRRDAALAAYYAWLPARPPVEAEQRYGAVRIGDLATLIFWETRLTARSDIIDWESFPVPADADPDDPDVQAAVTAWLETMVGDPTREMLGADQLAFVEGALTESVETGQPWRVIANQVIMGRTMAPDYPEQLPFLLKTVMRIRGGEVWEYGLRTRLGIPMTTDDWDGFPAERERVYSAAKAANADFIVLTGDTHNGWCNDLHDADGERRGTEFGVTSVSSPSEFEYVNAPGLDFGTLTEDRNAEVLRHNAYDKGYVYLTLTPASAEAELVTVSNIKSREFTVGSDSRWRVRPALGGPVPQVDRLD